MKVVPLRLHPGDDLFQALDAWMGEQEAQAGCLISGVGSLSVAQLRLAGAREATGIHGDLEILSLAGTLSSDGAHLHIAVADSIGAVIGGHLCPRLAGAHHRRASDRPAAGMAIPPGARSHHRLRRAADQPQRSMPERFTTARKRIDPVVAGGMKPKRHPLPACVMTSC